MPKTRSLIDYPTDDYGPAFMVVANTKVALAIPCPDGKQAASLRGDLYAFKRACGANIVKARLLGIDADAIQKVKIRINTEGLELYHVEDAPGVASIREALARLGVPVLPVASPVNLGEAQARAMDVEASIARLLAGKSND